MTDEQIIQALECCIDMECTKCPLNYDDCEERDFESLVKRAIPIFNRQKAEIERLEGILNRRCDVCPAVITAVKEFAERLKEKRDGGTYPYVLINVIDNLVKEMTEPTKLEHNSLCETETYMGE